MDERIVYEAIIQLLQSKTTLDCTKIRLSDEPLKAQGLDSLNLIRLVNALEEHFGIEIRDDEVFSTSSLIDLINAVCKKVKVRPAEVER